ncbi:N-acetylmuramidase domain-containing protein [Nitratireductor luteus]|uniref:N-acetylmuramidase domain-containing protein n=1 Tax=Nitratireductor luteus TaxID=2976980 RepID=UPI00223F5042|nr:N-acetylmuramidase domain-containing protein [Nitratireductor luteus]
MISADTARTIAEAAVEAGFEPAALLALVEVESAGRTHVLVDGRKEPLIRFEAHYFDRRLEDETRQRARDEGLASPRAGAVRNPPSQAARWALLERACRIDRNAAYESVSWGIGQVMGAHWSRLGYENVEALVAAARSGVEGQLRLTLRYIAMAGLANALKEKDWQAFARGYNGLGYARNGYHLKLSLAYRRHARGPVGTPEMQPRQKPARTGVLRTGDTGAQVRHVQTLLCALGYPVPVDGVFGPRTRAAILRFQRSEGLRQDGIVGAETLAAMEQDLPLAQAGHRFRKVFMAFWRRVGRLIL